MRSLVIPFKEINKAMLPQVGGKAANLGELARMEGLNVPDGFCISVDAFKTVVETIPGFEVLQDQLALLKAEDIVAIRELSAVIRKSVEGCSIPDTMTAQIKQQVAEMGEGLAYAIRSSATAEDLPAASFAGQQDSYLNIIGWPSILEHVRKCWASLFTARAVMYRIQQGFNHNKVQLAVIVQQMIFPQAAGVAFTADPIRGNRKLFTVDAGFGLGEALVSGLINPDNYIVSGGEIVDKKIPVKKLAVYANANGGTQHLEIEPRVQQTQVLTDREILELEITGRKIEHHFGSPQDIEWCLCGGQLYILQSRSITTLYPIPAADDAENRVYVSVGHQQMMTDAMKPLGLSVFLLIAQAPMRAAGSRLFVDITNGLASPASRENLLNVLGQSDPLIRSALDEIMGRGNFIRERPADQGMPAVIKSHKGMSATDILSIAGNDPAIVTELISNRQAAIALLQQQIQDATGTKVFDVIEADVQANKSSGADPRYLGVIVAAVNASAWLNEKMFEWLGEKNVADSISQSVANNITSEMGLALLDLADIIRPYPAVISFLQQVHDDDFVGQLAELEGGPEVRTALLNYLNKYGMRCAGEIDITKPRWWEKPATLIPLVIGNINNFAPGESGRKFQQGLQEAMSKEKELLSRLAQLPGGEQKVNETKHLISLVRNYIGYREYPKYAIVSRFFIYKQALMREAEQLVLSGVIHEKEDVYYLSFQEFKEVVHAQQLDDGLIPQRKAAYILDQKLRPPRVITSDGEMLQGRYKHDELPNNALPALAVSSGIIEGRANIVLNMEDFRLEDGDILITSFTDPSWTPLFVLIKGLVTEVGGLMTHGAVIAREYGIPAVVGLENATRLITTGQRIRVNGTEGYVEIL